MKVYITEKPSMGREIADSLGVVKKGDGYIETNDGVVTWAFGHLLEQYEPYEYDEKWQNRYVWETLPIIPETFKIKPKTSKRQVDGKWVQSKDQSSERQLNNIGNWMKQASLVVIATDADREGEAIARNILKWHNYRGPVKRLWLSSLDPESLKKALSNLKEGKETINLYFASEGRSEADWLVGMTMSRALTIRNGTGKRAYYSIGRIQTPTLALVVRRDREIENFKPKDYYELEALTTDGTHEVTLKYAPTGENRIFDKEKAQEVMSKIEGLKAPYNVKTARKKTKPPRNFSLPSLQKVANRKFGLSAQQVLDIAQALYEKHKYTTYPRSDCEYLPEEQIGDMPKILSNIKDFFPHVDLSEAQARKETYNTKKVTAHHAIVPTTNVQPNLVTLNEMEKKVYLLIAGRFIESTLPDYEYNQTVITMSVEAGIGLKTQGNVPVKEGWKKVNGKEKSDKDDEKLLPPIQNQTEGTVLKVDTLTKQTKPPVPYTDGTLLADMEGVGKYIEDKELKKILKGTEGLGTPATRAGIIETLLKREFIRKEKGKLRSEPKGVDLIEILEKHLPELCDAGQSGIWEQQLEEVAIHGRQAKADFVEAIKTKISDYLHKLESNIAATEGPGEKRDTAMLSWHPEHLTSLIEEDNKSWHIPGYGRVFKTVFGRPFTIEEIKNVILGESTLFDFVSKKSGKPYKANMAMDGSNEYGVNFKLIFEGELSEGPQETGVKIGKNAILDNGRYYLYKELPYPKMICNRAFTAEEMKTIIKSKEPIEFKGFKSNKGTEFSAKVKHTPKEKYTTQLVFENDPKEKS